MRYDTIVVGAGIAGLTSAAYLSKYGYQVLVCEKEKIVGGLVNSFEYKGFVFDGGIRAIENSGIVFPMLRQLGIGVDFVKNDVSIGIENEVLRLTSKDSLPDYQQLLNRQFPHSIDEIAKIIAEVARVMEYMDVLYGIDNPLFMDIKTDMEYLTKTMLPWFLKYLITMPKIQKLNTPIDEHLRAFTQNQTLIDIIAQHFFKKTPAFFALSYFSLYLDYQYPRGGTGTITDQLAQFVCTHGGTIKTETKISFVNPQARQITDSQDNTLSYRKLIWAADLKGLYRTLDINAIDSKKVRSKVMAQHMAVSDKVGGDSIFTLYLTLDIDKSFFGQICSAHFFYTPHKKGLSDVNIKELEIKSASDTRGKLTMEKPAIFSWLLRYFELTTYEIACPVLRDATMAPDGKTGLIISTLMDFALVRHISDMGWYDEFKKTAQECMVNVLDATIFPGLKAGIMDQFSSTPLTIERVTGNSDGAITGWAFTNDYIPAVNSFPKIMKSVLTPIPDVVQAGQWTYSPSGLPISILTGKLAADRIHKELK